MRFFIILLIIVLAGTSVFWGLTQPRALPDDAMAGLAGDTGRGQRLFWASGCASCHVAPDAPGSDAPILAGGQRFPSPYGTFIAPNISPDPDAGIGGWTALDLANAMLRGVSPEGQHYFPAFPYTSYARMTRQDIADLHAFLTTLPRSTATNQPHEVAFPYNIRRSLGLWKRLYLNPDWIVTEDLSAAATRGRYLVEAAGHCGECHTPRDALGGLDASQWLAGAPNPAGRGTIPNITPAALDWSEADIVEYLTSGFTPEYDSAGGHMTKVIENPARLPESDRQAIAAYLKRVVPVP